MSALLPLGSRRVLRLYFSHPVRVLALPTVVVVVVVGFVDWVRVPPLLAFAGVFLAQIAGLAHRQYFSLCVAFGTSRRDYWLGLTLGLLASGVAAATVGTLLYVAKLAIGRSLNPAYVLHAPGVGGGGLLIISGKLLALALLGLWIGVLAVCTFRAQKGSAQVALVAAYMAVLAVGAVAIGWLQSDSNHLSASGTQQVVALGGLGLAALIASANYVAIRRAGI